MTTDTLFNPIIKNLKEVPNLSIITIPTILLGLYAIFSLITNFTLLHFLYFVIGYFVVNVVGVTAGLHRYFSHNTFKVSVWKERILLFAAVLSGQGSPIWWTALHRGYHHRGSDTTRDPHSPIHGFWHSFIWWMFRIKPDAIQFRYAVDLLRNKEVVWVSSHYTKLWILINAILILISWEFFLYFSMMASFVTLVTYNLTNSLNHYPSLGYTNFATRDNSTNVPWIFPLVLGECWHNNHHARPGASHFGSDVSGKWWEFDPSGSFIKLFQDRPK